MWILHDDDAETPTGRGDEDEPTDDEGGRGEDDEAPPGRD